MKKTTNFSLPTYEANDIPNLLDGYNNAIGIIDKQMKQNDDNATEALVDANNALAMAQANATKINNEVTRAKAAEAANTTLINNEVTRAKAAEAANTTLINNEVTRAKAAEDDIEQNISDTADKIMQDVTSNKTAIEALKEKDIFLLLGDSWAAFNEGFENWFEYGNIATTFNCVLKNYAKGGAAYTKTNNSFLMQLNNAITELTVDEKTRVKYICLVGGVNDVNDQGKTKYTEISTELFNLLDSCVSNFPNAAIRIITNSANNYYTATANSCFYSASIACDISREVQFYKNANVAAPANCYFYLGAPSKNIYGDDNLHLNVTGARAFSRHVIRAFTGGVVSAKLKYDVYALYVNSTGLFTCTFSDFSISAGENIGVFASGTAAYDAYMMLIGTRLHSSTQQVYGAVPAVKYSSSAVSIIGFFTSGMTNLKLFATDSGKIFATYVM